MPVGEFGALAVGPWMGRSPQRCQFSQSSQSSSNNYNLNIFLLDYKANTIEMVMMTELLTAENVWL